MTPELKEKLLRYANEKEPFTAHNHIRVCDIDEGSSRLELDLTEQSLNRWGQPHGGVARRLIARGRVTRAGRRTCFCQAEITTAQGKLLAVAHSVWAYTGKPLPLGD